MFFIWSLWSSMISYKASFAQICVLFRLNDYKWSLSKPRSPRPNMFFFYLLSMIVNDLLQSLSRPKMVFIWSLWSSMISYKASVTQICVLFRFNDRQWSLTKPRSPKYQYPDHVRTAGPPVMLPNSCRRCQFCWKMRLPPPILLKNEAAAAKFEGKWGHRRQFCRKMRPPPPIL